MGCGVGDVIAGAWVTGSVGLALGIGVGTGGAGVASMVSVGVASGNATTSMGTKVGSAILRRMTFCSQKMAIAP